MKETLFKKTGRAMLASALALIMCMCLLTSAFATGEITSTGETSLSAALTKVLQTGEGTTLPSDMNFTFTFTQDTAVTKDSAGNDIVVSTVAVPIKPVTTTVTTAMTGTATTGMKTYEVQSGNFLAQATDNANYTQAGIYVYKVKETANTYTIADATKETMTYSGAEYTLYVYVANKTDNSGVYIKSIGCVLTKGDDGAATDGNVGNKVDPTPGTPGTTGEVLATNSDMKFTNKYVKNNGGVDPTTPASRTLTISKTVSGALGDQSKYFTYTATMAKPTVSTKTSYKAYVVNSTTNAVETAAANYGGTLLQDANNKAYFEFPTDGSSVTFMLHHNQSLVFTDAEVGARYAVTEAGATGYVPSAVLTQNAVETTIAAGTAGSAYAVPATGTALVGEGLNKAAITNTMTDVTPTGIIMNNLPFFVLILIAMGTLVAFVVVRSKKKQSDSRQ
jgi:hypothetical protein